MDIVGVHILVSCLSLTLSLLCLSSWLCMGEKKGTVENTVHNNTGPDRCLGRGAPRNDPPIRRAVAQSICSMQQSTQLHTLSLCFCWTPMSHHSGHHHQQTRHSICKHDVVKLKPMLNAPGNTCVCYANTAKHVTSKTAHLNVFKTCNRQGRVLVPVTIRIQTTATYSSSIINQTQRLLTILLWK